MGSRRRSERQYHSVLPGVERWTYFGTTVITILYIFYCVYRDSIKYDGILNLYDFRPGWSILGREQDISNFEWHFWYNMLWKLAPWYMGHFALSKILEWNCLKYRKHGFVIFGALSLCKLVGWFPVALYITHGLVLYLAALTASTIVVWLISLALLSTLNFEPFISVMKGWMEDDEEERWYYLLMFTLALTNIRATSFCVEKCWNKHMTSPKIDMPSSDDMMYQQMCPTSEGRERESTPAKREPSDAALEPSDAALAYGLLDLLSYTLYLPLFFTGPILTYDRFNQQFNAPIPNMTRGRAATLAFNFVRFTFWAFFNEFLLHYLYFHSLQQNIEVLKTVSLFTLAGLGYCHGQFFMIKYLVMFGLPASVARLDHLDPPQGPKCISYVYLYSDMWKYFDRGLYNFLKRYIYVPCGGSQAGASRQVIGSIFCFMYIFYWHGAEFYILQWILLNYVGVSFEQLGSVLVNTSLVKHIETNILSAAMVQRLHAFCSIPIFLLSCFSMFCFFGGHMVFNMFFQRLIVEGWPWSWVGLTILVYCAIQNAMEVNAWSCSRRQKTKQS